MTQESATEARANLKQQGELPTTRNEGLYELLRIGRGERIRTSDPLVPNQVLYQAEPRPVIA